MKLRAKVTRSESFLSKAKVFKAVFPKGVTPHMRESILERNLGARPYSEISMMENGESVRIWIK
jgi:hypothetical protein